MKLLFCVEFYYPSIGGAQEVVRQVAERLAARGHDVTVATSWLQQRSSDIINGVKVVGFNVSGNKVRGLSGDIDAYRDFIRQSDADVLFFYAAQQWTFDAAWETFADVRAKKVFVPCGYSGLYNSAYADYFQKLPAILRRLDAVVYHAESYRDIDFARDHGLTNSIVIPNGAAAEEFSVDLDPEFRSSIGAKQDTQILLTVGSATGLKGHLELARAFALADFGGREALLIINGNQPSNGGHRRSYLRRFQELVRTYGLVYAFRHSVKMFLIAAGWRGGNANSIEMWVASVNDGRYGKKRVLRVDLPRAKLVQAYLQSDLFVFASNIEYSPLVLYEACAAGLPFLTVPVGNTAEIVAWTGGGEMCDAPHDSEGYTRAEPEVLARAIKKLLDDRERRATLGVKGKAASEARFNWASLAKEYEDLFSSLIQRHPQR
ncbi:glycosyltransferase family 4 protein [Agrobacterium tumefaciens]|uniref:glycosyltransferase family 4 protein n=1 Tax=Agrobacterium tumefaciens TaxID=358 RepID=UPI00287F225E|nr:glycosyltransferase family 4 protein [Agrobacterium tumefaciens]MDS7594770.1 glycosyltransferase family 4 protein [Agrobacterium tumefaciens]